MVLLMVRTRDLVARVIFLGRGWFLIGEEDDDASESRRRVPFFLFVVPKTLLPPAAWARR
jgi:hypothetical protein